MSDFYKYDAETAILSIIINFPDQIFSLQQLKPFMFSSMPNQVLFDAMMELSKNNSIPEKVLLISWLESRNKLNDSGGKDYIEYLSNQRSDVSNISQFESIIVSAYKARQIISTIASVKNNLDNINNVDQIIADLRKTIDSLDENSGGDTTLEISSYVETAWQEIKEKIEHPEKSGTPLGIKSLDSITGGIRGGEYFLIAGRPGMLKTGLMCNSILATARAGNPVLVFSLEMRRQPLVERLLSIESGVPVQNLRLGTLDKKEIEIIQGSLKSFKNLPIYIDTMFSPSLYYATNTIRKYVRNKGVKIVYLDYLQLFAERSENQTQELGHLSRTFKLLANELNIGMVILAQVNRLVELRPDKRPILSDIRQCGNIEEDIDLAGFLYRDEYYTGEKSKYPGIMEFIIRKNRNGPIGMLPLNYKLDTNKIWS